ncbi:hypothetical protein TNCV_2087221 [Trichonephila clavipes]|nr:hypothetical protein TNCV_2087221 [Trichonephila clavipes]
MTTLANWESLLTHGCCDISLSLVPLKVRRVEEFGAVKSAEAQTSSYWCGVIVMRAGTSICSFSFELKSMRIVDQVLDHKLVAGVFESQVRELKPLKTIRLEGVMHFNSAATQPSRWRNEKIWLGTQLHCRPHRLIMVQIYEVLDESRSFFRVHTGYFSNIPKCIKAEFIASWACPQSSVVSSSQR